MRYSFDISPTPAPRMTTADKWKNRPIVLAYFGYRDRIRYESRLKALERLPDTLESLIFYIPIPGSWSAKKKNQMIGKPHEQTPDLDNLIRGFLDCFGDDKHINSICASKVWSEYGKIELEIENSATSSTPIYARESVDNELFKNQV